MVKIFGLTGSIATGKSFIADFFLQNKVPVFSSDEEVANLLKENKIIEKIKQINYFGPCINSENQLDKNILSKLVFANQDYLLKLEEILHPLVKENMQKFIENNFKEAFILLEVPLLFEKNYQSLCYKVITSFCNKKLQQERALKRKNMDLQRLEFILKRQTNFQERAIKSNYLISTDLSPEFSTHQIKQIFHKEGIKCAEK